MSKEREKEMKTIMIVLGVVGFVGIVIFLGGFWSHTTMSRLETQAAADLKDSSDYHQAAWEEKMAHAKTQDVLDRILKKCHIKDSKLNWLKADGVGDPVCAEKPEVPQALPK